MRQISFAPGERVGQLAAGVHRAKEDVAQCVSTVAAGEPRFKNRGRIVDPRHGDRAARFKHHDGVGIGGSDLRDHGILIHLLIAALVGGK